MSEGSENIEQELTQVDQDTNPYTEEVHGKPATEGQDDRREKFAKLHGGRGDQGQAQGQGGTEDQPPAQGEGQGEGAGEDQAPAEGPEASQPSAEGSTGG